MTAPIRRGTQTSNDGATTGFGATVVAGFGSIPGLVAGDTVVIDIPWQFNGVTLATPAGWTLLWHPTGSGGNQMATIYKQVTAGEITTGSVTITFSGGTAVSAPVATAYAGTVTFGTPVDAVSGNTPPLAAPSVTMTTADGELHTAFAITHATLEPGTVAFANGTNTGTSRTARAAASNVRVTVNALAAPGTGSKTAGATTVTGNAAATQQGIAFEVIGAAAVAGGGAWLPIL